MPIQTILSYQTDLSAGVTRTPVRPALFTQDSQAHTFRVACVRAGSAENLANAAVRGYFLRADGVTVPMEGVCSGHVASVTLSPACYAVPGRFQLVIRVSLGDAASTVFFGDGAVTASMSDALLDDERIIPSLDELLRQIDAMEAATAAANRVAGMTVRASTLPPGSAATASYADGVLSLGLPRGDVGQVGAPGGGAPLNLLGNSFLADPVNQRGASGYTGVGYGIDRWTGGNAASKVWINPGRSISFFPQTEGTAAYWRQYLDYRPERLYGKTFTLAIHDTWGNTYLGTGTYPAAAPDGVTTVIWITLATDRTFVLYCKTDGTAFVQLNTKDTTTVIDWVALYEGAYTLDTLPAYVPKGYAAELLDCQRYYHVYATEAARPANGMDCCPPMRLSGVSQGTVSVGGVTCYYNSAEL